MAVISTVSKTGTSAPLIHFDINANFSVDNDWILMKKNRHIWASYFYQWVQFDAEPKL